VSGESMGLLNVNIGVFVEPAVDSVLIGKNCLAYSAGE